MIDIHQLDNVIDDIREEAGYDDMKQECQVAFDELIGQSTVMDLLDRYLKFQGIIGYTEQILNALETICAADSTNPAHLCEKLVAYCWDDEETSYRETYGEMEDVIEHAAAQEGEPHIFCVLARLHLANNQSF